MAGETLNEGSFKTDIDLYEKGRPEYTKESVEYLLKKAGALGNTNDRPLNILELGAGTGKFTRALVEALKELPNIRIIASDPQASMCERFRKIVPGIEIMQFLAEKIPFSEESIDIVIAAQSFHWFANAQAVTEIHRVLVPKGFFGMIWNKRNFAEVDWVAKVEDIIKPYYGLDNSMHTLENTWMQPIKNSQLFGELEGNNDLRFYKDGSADDLITTVMSISWINNLSNDKKKDVELRIREVLENHPDLKGLTKIELPYVIRIYWCTKK